MCSVACCRLCLIAEAESKAMVRRIFVRCRLHVDAVKTIVQQNREHFADGLQVVYSLFCPRTREWTFKSLKVMITCCGGFVDTPVVSKLGNIGLDQWRIDLNKVNHEPLIVASQFFVPKFGRSTLHMFFFTRDLAYNDVASYSTRKTLIALDVAGLRQGTLDTINLCWQANSGDWNAECCE